MLKDDELVTITAAILLSGYATAHGGGALHPETIPNAVNTARAIHNAVKQP